jgi:phosphoribosylformylglycinamidine (FGAM) synthase-like enzyme
VSSPYLKVFKANGEVANIPAESLVLGGDAPVYQRKIKIPDYIKQIRDINITNIKKPADYNSSLMELLTCPNIGSKNWIF